MAEVEARTTQLLAEIESSWADTEPVTAMVESAVKEGWPQPAAGELAGMRGFLERPGRPMLAGPLEHWQRKRPLQRALNAFETWSTGLDSAARMFPLRQSLCLEDCAEAVGVKLPLWRRPGASRGRLIEIRGIILAEAARLELERSRLDGEWQLLLARHSMLVPASWLSVCHWGLTACAGLQPDEDPAEMLGRIAARTAEFKQRAIHLLADYRIWSVKAKQRLNQCLLDPPRRPERRRERRLLERSRHFAFWSRQQRAVAAWLDTQLQMWNLSLECVEECERALDSLCSEHACLSGEAKQVLEWLETVAAGAEAGPFPNAQARLVSAEERAAEWVRRIQSRVRRRLPQTIESVQPGRALPGWRKPWRRIEPQSLIDGHLQTVSRGVVRDGLHEAESAHSAMVREVERAREVVAFGFEQDAAPGGGEGLAREAAANAAGLLVYRRDHTREPRESVEPMLVNTITAAMIEAQRGLDRGRLGLLAHATRRRGISAAAEIAAAGLAVLPRGARRIMSWGESGLGWLMLKAGLATPTAAREKAVKRRPVLGEALALSLGDRELPALYRRLFRLAPVEDPRFLIGRENEMGGLTDALGQWEDGRHAAVLIIGARGSGKTSLLNCAAAGLFSGKDVVRTQFSERIRTASQLAGFLARSLGLEAGADPEPALRAARRVVIIEELERAYLGVAGGYEPLLALLDLIESTSGSTLWILSLNEAAFRHLNAAAGLGRHFSHQVNAMSVEQRQLEAAILYRHHLSGMRLQFSPLPQGDARVRRVRQTFGIEKSPQELFFQSLYAQSGGIFRSAFELWQDSIERVEGGTVSIRQPLSPAYGPLMEEMDQADQFVVRAVTRHGSLTFGETAEMFLEDEAWARRRIRRLVSLDILEQDPAAAGFRVKPQAGKLVRDRLFRSNLH
ncbi:MAG: ATP-binding protein [Bryobacteraceae bacterium]|nr:ATP-binding protein [Bryobacteraceae bacterium]